MTFIENVFKYGISKHKPAIINISIAVEENKISFFCQNTIFENVKETNRKGIGIANTKQRLEHIYPGKYALDINNNNNLFTVKLEIDC